LLVAAGGNPRDFAILMTFLQTGVRVSELCALTLDDVDFEAKQLHVRAGKGMSARTIELEKKGTQVLRSWLAVRPKVASDRLFLNRDEEPLGERGVQKLLAKYCQLAGITKRISPHSLRHTFASFKAEAGVSPFQLQQWLGHASLDTTQIYVKLAKKNAKKVMEATSL
jgi:integrase/recombinase XerD